MKQYQIDLKALTDDETRLEYALDNQFFAALPDAEIREGQVQAQAVIRKLSGAFELLLTLSGEVKVPCDLCLEAMDQPVAAESRMLVKLGDAALDEGNDELIVVDEAEGLLDLAWLLYEQIALAVPIKHIHAPGKCNRAMTQKLAELSAARSSDEGQAVDPRWEALKKLKI